MENNKIKKLIKESVSNLINNTIADTKIKKIISKHNVKTHFVPIKYRIFGGLLQSLNIQFGNFIEVLMQRIIEEEKQLEIIDEISGKKNVLLVVGGIGAGPMIYLAKTLMAEVPDMVVTVFAGAKTEKHLPFQGPLDEISLEIGFALREFSRSCAESVIATDDGSVGYHGFITNCFKEWLSNSGLNAEETIICSCGPEIMLSQVAQIALERKIDCQVSMERRMACGIGICQGCAVECKAGDSNETVYKMCCTDGPVFDSSEVVFICD